MKRQLLLSFALTVLAANAFALPAAEQPAPQVKSDAASISQPLKTIAADGADRLQGTPVAENGRNRLEEKGLAADGADRVQTNGLAADGADRVQTNGLAADGVDRLAEQHQQLS